MLAIQLSLGGGDVRVATCQLIARVIVASIYSLIGVGNQQKIINGAASQCKFIPRPLA